MRTNYFLLIISAIYLFRLGHKLLQVKAHLPRPDETQDKITYLMKWNNTRKQLSITELLWQVILKLWGWWRWTYMQEFILHVSTSLQPRAPYGCNDTSTWIYVSIDDQRSGSIESKWKHRFISAPSLIISVHQHLFSKQCFVFIKNNRLLFKFKSLDNIKWNQASVSYRFEIVSWQTLWYL